jgi:hypothetical protein
MLLKLIQDLEHWHERITIYKDEDYLGEQNVTQKLEYTLRELKRISKYYPSEEKIEF